MSHTSNPKKQPLEDWHRADIIAALRKAGWSSRRLSVYHGYAPTTLKHALNGDSSIGEKIIADAIGLSAEDIWPARIAQRQQRQQARLKKRQQRQSTRRRK